MKTTFVLLLVQFIVVTLEYELRCPVAGEWRLRPRKYKCGATQYVCLLYLPDKQYHETCDGLDYSSTGSKLVFEPNFNKARCNYNRYQPFPFSTHGSSECVYRKSFCNEEGQLVSDRGGYRNDTRCGCDFSKGYSFVAKPRNNCFCIPLEEDCSCQKLFCNNKDNNCTRDVAASMNSTCSAIPDNNKSEPSQGSSSNKRKYITEHNDGGRNYRLKCVYFTVTFLILIIVTGFFADQLTITVTINEDEIATDYGQPITLTFDVNVAFPCFVKSIEWYKNDHKIECCSIASKYQSNRKLPTLTINNIAADDIGYYKCVLETIFTKRDSATLHLVSTSPLVTVKKKSIEIPENGKSTVLSCEITSYFKIISVQWYKGTKPIYDKNKKYTVKSDTSSILTINDVHKSDTGIYKCEVTNEKGTTIESEDILLQVVDACIQEETHTRDEDHIPRNIRDQHGQEIREWEQDQSTFVETRATRQILKSLFLHHCIVVTGCPGCGKSAHIHHAALHLRDEFGYEIIPVLTGPTDIIHYYNENKKQVFVVDDIYGKETINTHTLQIWRDYSENLMKKFVIEQEAIITIKSSKILLISCRLHIYKESQLQRSSLLTIKEFNLLSPEFCLQQSERNSMLHKYLSDDIVDNVKQVLENSDYFPLLCKLSKHKTSEEVKKLFTSPLNIVQENIKIIIVENKAQFCALVLCILFDGGFNTDWLKSISASKENKEKLEDIVKEFEIDLSNEMPRNFLESGFSTLNGTYLKLRGTKYGMIHDMLYKIAGVICGQRLRECFIKYAPSDFIQDHFMFESLTKVGGDNDSIVLSKNQEEDYFERLLYDLKYDVITSTFYNKMIIHPSFRNKLISFFERIDVKTVLKQLDTEGCIILNNADKLKSPLETNCFTTPLMESASTGYVDIVQFLIVNVQCNVNKTDEIGRTPLYKASERGHSDVVKLLVENNADVSQCNDNKWSPLHAACAGGDTDTVKLLLKNKADVFGCTNNGESPLCFACERGYTDIVQLLLQNKADVSKCNNWKWWSPLHMACERGYTDIVQLLLQNNADVSKCGFYGSPLYVACERGHTDTVKVLLQYEADVSQCDENDESPLFVACKGGHDYIVELLLRNKAEVSQCNIEGESPLFVACKGLHTKTIELLLQNQADASRCNDDGQSPLHVACDFDTFEQPPHHQDLNDNIYLRHIETVKILLACNPNVELCNKNGQTPLDIARKAQCKEIVNLLEENLKLKTTSH